jgi:pimeloyl-ACP methyl ester carboxylesterase
MFHRSADGAGVDAPAIVHVHGFGISGTYMQPTAALLAPRFRTFVPDLPGHGRSHRLKGRIDLPRLAASLAHYCQAVGVERATFVGNSLGCPTICALATDFPDLVERVVLVSPAGGPNNQPLGRALWQMAVVGPREPRSMVPIAVRDYLHFGVGLSLSLFRAMTRFPTIERLQALQVPTLVVVGERDPLIRLDRVSVLHPIPHVHAVVVPGAHALNYSHPDVVAALVAAHIDGTPLHSADGPLAATREVTVPR